ncbi:MAG: Uncharacterised protein [Flavobacteriia bacterium]|nr:MAG: Uncharacterised protein [Flavobacteriia bacterium]
MGHQRRIFAFHPIQISVVHKAGEEIIGLSFLHLQDLLHVSVFGLFQRDLPIDQFLVEFHPARPVAYFIEFHSDPSEGLLVVHIGLFVDQSALVQILLQAEQELVRIDRFDQVICDLSADGFLHNVFFLALGDHHHRQSGTDLLDLFQGFQTIHSRHVFVQKDQVVGFAAYLIQGVVPVVHCIDCVVFFAKEDQVGFEQFDLIIHPENACRLHILIYVRP